jgi:signal transduction histidine kinase
VKGLRSLKARFIVGSVLWTLGLLGASHLAFVFGTQYFPHVLVIQHWTVLGVLALVFMLGGLSQVRRGLSPINDVRQRLAALRQGRARRLDGTYPSEVQPLVDDLNALLEHREEAVRRAQAKAGDLAHGLKTPLACRTGRGPGRARLARSGGQRPPGGGGMRRQVGRTWQARGSVGGHAGRRCGVPSAELARTLIASRGARPRASGGRARSPGGGRSQTSTMLGNLLDSA